MAKKKSTLNRQAGNIRSKYTRQGIKTMKDFEGSEIPLKYVPAREIVEHDLTINIIDEVKDIHRRLAELKAKCQAQGDAMYDELMAENGIKATSKGGFQIQNFDKTLKVQFRMDTVEEVDAIELELCKQAKDRFIDKVISDMPDNVRAIIPLLEEVFENSKGKIDVRRLRSLNKYRSSIKDKDFHQFLDHGNAAVSLRHTKRKEVFSEKNDQGVEKSIVLNYSYVDAAKLEEE